MTEKTPFLRTNRIRVLHLLRKDDDDNDDDDDNTLNVNYIPNTSALAAAYIYYIN